MFSTLLKRLLKCFQRFLNVLSTCVFYNIAINPNQNWYVVVFPMFIYIVFTKFYCKITDNSCSFSPKMWNTKKQQNVLTFLSWKMSFECRKIRYQFCWLGNSVFVVFPLFLLVWDSCHAFGLSKYLFDGYLLNYSSINCYQNNYSKCVLSLLK